MKKAFMQAAIECFHSVEYSILNHLITGNILFSIFISDLHKGHAGCSSKVNATRIQPLQDSFVHDQTSDSTSGTGSLRPR